MNTLGDMDRGLLKALSDVPEMPDIYPGIIHSIKRGKSIVRLSWACAALFALCFTSLVYISNFKSSEVSPEVFEELNAVQAHVNGEDIKDDSSSYSLLADDF